MESGQQQDRTLQQLTEDLRNRRDDINRLLAQAKSQIVQLESAHFEVSNVLRYLGEGD